MKAADIDKCLSHYRKQRRVDLFVSFVDLCLCHPYIQRMDIRPVKTLRIIKNRFVPSGADVLNDRADASLIFTIAVRASFNSSSSRLCVVSFVSFTILIVSTP